MARHCVPGTPVSDTDLKEKEAALPSSWLSHLQVAGHGGQSRPAHHFSTCLTTLSGGLEKEGVPEGPGTG